MWSSSAVDQSLALSKGVDAREENADTDAPKGVDGQDTEIEVPVLFFFFFFFKFHFGAPGVQNPT